MIRISYISCTIFLVFSMWQYIGKTNVYAFYSVYVKISSDDIVDHIFIVYIIGYSLILGNKFPLYAYVCESSY